MYNLGLCYFQGRGIEEDPQWGFHWTLKAAQLGDLEAQEQLPVIYFNGMGVKKNEVLAALWLQKIKLEKAKNTNKSDLAGTINNLGLCYLKEEETDLDKELGVKLLKEAIALGNINALFNLACCYEIGLGVEKNLSIAFEYFTKAAHFKFPEALFVVAQYYKHGTVIEANPELSLLYHKEAADLGHLKSAIKLLNYFITVKDYSTALVYTTKAAELGNIDAINLAILCYLEGFGTPINFEEALSWLNRLSVIAPSYLYNFAILKIGTNNELAFLYLIKSYECGNKQAAIALKYMYKNNQITLDMLQDALQHFKMEKSQILLKNLAGISEIETENIPIKSHVMPDPIGEQNPKHQTKSFKEFLNNKNKIPKSKKHMKKSNAIYKKLKTRLSLKMKKQVTIN